MTNFESRVRRTYSQEDVQKILNLAIARQADDKEKEFSYEQLQEIAAELEISPETLQQAERDWLDTQGEMQQRQAFNLYRQGRFKKRLGNYAIFNLFFISLDAISFPGLSWSLYILLGCGLTLGLDTWNTFLVKGEEYEKAFVQWRRKHQVKKFFNSVVNRWLRAVSG